MNKTVAVELKKKEIREEILQKEKDPIKQARIKEENALEIKKSN